MSARHEPVEAGVVAKFLPKLVDEGREIVGDAFHVFQ